MDASLDDREGSRATLGRRYHDYLRWLYRGGHPNRFARLQNRMSALVFATGIWPTRLGTLEVRGRRSGRTISFPVVIADHEGERYLVAMLGDQAAWVRNVRADGGRAVPVPPGRTGSPSYGRTRAMTSAVA